MHLRVIVALSCSLVLAAVLTAQPPGGGPPGMKGGPFGGPGGGPGGPKRKLVDKFDKDGDGRLNTKERAAAREFLKKDREGKGGFGFGPPGGKGGFGKGPGGFGKGGMEPGKPGPKVEPKDVKTYPNAPLYDPTTLRTLFLDFENKDWEAELADFYRTDVEVPATLTVDGKSYKDVGVHFRGMSSYFTVPAGLKRSLNLSLDFVKAKQNLYGYRTLNLLNSHDDPSCLHTVLFAHIARNYLPTPKANLVKVVINGESWGIYVSAQQFNKEFLAENYQTTKGVRWKVKGSPGAGGGLDYISDNIDDYKRRYEIKSKDNADDWKALIQLCKTLSKTPTEQLEAALQPLLDIDGALWFLALDIGLINNDGYWIRASDYSLYRDPKGKFHVVPHDMNETFAMPGGPGFGKGGPGGKGPGGPPGGGPPGGGFGAGGLKLDPLFGLDDVRKPLRSRLLAVPAWKERYLKNVRTLADVWLDWKKLGPLVKQYRGLIEKEVELDTRKLYSTSAFLTTTADVAGGGAGAPGGFFGRGMNLSLRSFAEQRREYLLNYAEAKKATP